MSRARASKVWGIVLALLVVVGGAGGNWGSPAVAPAWAAPLQQAAPGPFVQQAFDLLLDRFVTPPSSQTLLAGGWEGGARFVQERANAAPEGTAPTFAGDRAADWGAFLAAYPALVVALGGAAEQVDLDRAIVSGMAASLDSSHTFFEREAGGAQTQQRFGGIGVLVTRDMLIREVFPGTPAEAAGVRMGDRIVGVDGTPVDGFIAQQLSERIRGPVGSNVTLSVLRSGEPLELSIARAEIAVDWVTSRVLDDGIGYLRLRAFAPPEGLPLFEQAMSRLVDGGLRALVLDIRGNGGGLTFPQVASRFIQGADLIVATGRDNQRRVVRTSGGFWERTLPITVLVDGESRSAAELFAAVMRENTVALVIGVPTAGQAENGRRFPLVDGSSLGIAVEHLATAQGQVLEKQPLQPDMVVELDPAMLAQGKDSQLEAAMAHLRGKLGQ